MLSSSMLKTCHLLANLPFKMSRVGWLSIYTMHLENRNYLKSILDVISEDFLNIWLATYGTLSKDIDIVINPVYYYSTGRSMQD